MDLVGSILLFFVFSAVVLYAAYIREVWRLEEKNYKQNLQMERRSIYSRAKNDERVRKERENKIQLKASILSNFFAEHFGSDMHIRPVCGVTEIKSMSEPNVKYQVDLGNQTCTCEDFKRRKLHPRDHVARWCKHLRYAFDQVGAFSSLKGLQAAVVEFRFTQCDKMYMVKHRELPAMIFTISYVQFSKGWININARKTRKGENIKQASGPFENFGWNRYQKRWSYGDGPPGASHLRPLLRMAEASNIEELLEEICHASAQDKSGLGTLVGR